MSAIAVGKLPNGPLQCQIQSSAIASSLGTRTPAGNVLIRHPYDKSPSAFALLELSAQNSVHCRELAYFKDAASSEAQAGEIVPHFDCNWSEEVKELERETKMLRPDLGKAADREFAVTDFSELYEGALYIIHIYYALEIREESC